MSDTWERVYAKFFYALVGVVIAVVLAYVIVTDLKLAIALIAVWGISMALPRVVPTRIRVAISGWVLRSRFNSFLYFATSGALTCLVLFSVRRRVDWGYIINFVMLVPMLNAILFRSLSHEATPDHTSDES